MNGAPAFRLDLSLFEGPLDLLLYLVRREDLDLRELPVAEVAEQYLAYVEAMEVIDLDAASEYLLMAATLAWLKSRLLLPRVDEATAEEVADLQAELIERLVAYERFQRAARRLEDRPLLGRDVFPARVEPPPSEGDPVWAPVSAAALFEAWARLAARVAAAEAERALRFDLAERTLEEGAARLAERFRRRARWRLEELMADVEDRADLIVRFLALLELVRLGVLGLVAEPGPAGAIHVSRRGEHPVAEYPALVRGAYEDADRTADGDR